MEMHLGLEMLTWIPFVSRLGVWQFTYIYTLEQGWLQC